MTAPDREADFAAFYRREFGRVVASVRGQLVDDAEDAAQEAFLVAARRWGEVAALDVPAAWVRHVARRIAGRQAARERQRIVVEGASPVADPSAPGLDLDLVAALLELPGRHAAAVWLHHLEDRPVAEVAEVLGCSVPAAKVLLLRARGLLAERLAGITGSWVSERTWTPDAIAAHLRGIGAGHHIGPVLEEDLSGRGGRWELTIIDGAYTILRDDGYRLDHGASRVRAGRLELRPTLNTGSGVFRPIVDGDGLRLRLLETTIPDTRGVPDEVWISLFHESGAFLRTSRPAM